jgi:hypothetical protein
VVRLERMNRVEAVLVYRMSFLLAITLPMNRAQKPYPVDVSQHFANMLGKR